MKLAKQYAQALYEILAKNGDSSRLGEQFLAVVNERRHRSLLPAIVSELEFLFARQQNNKALVTVARTEDEKRYQNDIATHTSRDYVLKVQPAVVGGFKVETTSTRFDATFRKKLLLLYRQLTA